MNKTTRASDTDLHEHKHDQNRFAVIPTAGKLNAKPEFTGKDVCIAFLDSGFYPHPDFAERVIAFEDISGEEKSFGTDIEPQGFHWHGTQTVVSCAGNGKLSDGVYAGIASQSSLVLVKVSENGGRIPETNIEKGLQWILENHKKFDIKIVNMSLGGDVDIETEKSKINQLAEELVRQGICITVAAGNSAETHSIPPASSPAVITVGGYSDENQLGTNNADLYHSSFGTTADGLLKPEIIAPAMYVAAPILPNTSLYESAEALSILAFEPDYSFREKLELTREIADLPEAVLSAETKTIREIIAGNLQENKIIATHYQHVDGTSFAAPIVASVIAQMLEANPELTPSVIKNILISTASRLADFPAIRQGYGIVNANLAVEKALNETHFFDHRKLGFPFINGDKIIFSFHDDSCESVFLVGDFNDWKQNAHEFKQTVEGIWQAEIPCQPGGKYAYKYLINGGIWIEDPNHGFKEDDGFGGFNSILQIL